ncbi:kelch-like protein 28 isoform X3 [Styela clava]
MNLTLDAYDLKHCGKMMMALNKQRESKEHTDFAIMVGDEKIPAHRNVLSAGSDYFRAMLSHENVESSSGVVVMKEVQYSSVKSCIDYIYTGHVSTADSEQLMHTAHMLQLQVESCNKYALRNFQSIAAGDDFKHLDEEYVSFLLGSKVLNATEEVKCKALIIWSNFDVVTRTSTFVKLFENLDLAKISEKYQKFLLEKEPLVFDSARHHATLMNTSTGGSNVVAEDIDITNAAKPINAIAVFDMKSRSIHAFHPKTKTWTKLQGISADFVGKHFTAVALDDIIYVLLFDGTNYQLNYTDINATWVRLEDRRLTKNRVAAIAFEGSIYAFDDSCDTSKTVEKFDSSDGTWSHVADKPVEGCSTSIIAVGSFIYCIGGYNEGNLSNTVMFNPSDSTWTTLPPMTNARNRAAAVELDGKIYVIGGYTDEYLNMLECFDTVSETWTTVPCLNNSRGHFNACVIEEKIFAVERNRSKSTIEEFDFTVNSWVVVGTLGRKNIEKGASIILNVPL